VPGAVRQKPSWNKGEQGSWGMKSQEPAAGEPQPEKRTKPRRRQRVDTNIALLFGTVVVVFLAMAIARPTMFPTPDNISSMAFQVSEIGILTLGMMLAILIGGIDLSVNATANLAAIFAGMLLTRLMPGGDAGAGGGLWALWSIALAVGVALVTGAVCGLINGVLIAYVEVPAILATLTTMTIYTGLAFGITKGTSISGFSDAVLYIGNGYLLGIPMPMVILIVCVIIVWFLLERTTYGFKVYMVGSNPTAAVFSGVNNRRIILTTHILTGLLSAIAGFVALARTNSANPEYGVSYILMTILIAVLGGVSVYGGHGKVWGVVLALAALQLLSTGFNMLLVRHGGSNFFRDFAWGTLLLIVMTITYLLDNRPWSTRLRRTRSADQV
jgi:simple sugar transport system permease protein